MSIPGSGSPLLFSAEAAAPAGADTKSLRFNDDDSAYLDRTPSSQGDLQKWTWSGWVKLCGGSSYLFSAGNQFYIFVYNTGQIRLSTNTAGINSTRLLRDYSAWLHLVVAVDTTLSTQADRIKVYINGEQDTVTNYGSIVSQNQNTTVNSTAIHTIGKSSVAGQYADCYMADVVLIDGQQLAPTSFAETDATTGAWNPLSDLSGLTYGTNGFKLDFSDNSTVSALGTDSSGNGNNWTVNNLSVTAGAGNDSLFDSPTNGTQTDTGAGGEVSGNYSCFNPLAKNSNTTLSNGNLDVSSTAVYTTLSTIAFPADGKFYAEFRINGTASGYPFVGIGGFNDTAIQNNANPNTGAFYAQGGYITGSVSVSGLTALSAGDIVGVAYDASNGKTWFSLNGTYVNSGNPAGGTNETCTLSANASGLAWAVSTYQAGTVSLNAGQRAFSTNAPTGFKCLCTANFDTPTIEDPSTVMDVVKYDGTGSSQTITLPGTGFDPDFIWIKKRSAAADHVLYDAVRGFGTSATKTLYSNLTNSEDTTSVITSTTSTGFNLSGSGSETNQSSATYVGWCWDAGTSTASNTSGSISAQVRANISAGFSVLTYTVPSSGTQHSVGHGLGIAPSLVICKDRNDGSNPWGIYHSALGVGKGMLFSTAAEQVSSAWWDNTDPTSSVFYLNSGIWANAQNSHSYVAYCWAAVEGYSAFGSYTGNGSSDGPFVYTGFRPRWILTKTTNGVNHWDIYDAARDSYNVADAVLKPNSSGAEATLTGFDLLSNGFKARGTDSENNGSGDTYIYAAFAESPFKYARAR